MSGISGIVAPVVFSDNCKGALRYAVALASRFGAELTILHVVEPLIPFETEPREALDYIAKARREWAVRELGALAFVMRDRRISIRTAVLEGDPAREIVSYSAASKADLIVMATHGHGPFRRFLLGSVTAKVLHDASCPVWTGAHLEQALAPHHIEIRNILCAVDFDDQANRLLRWTAALATKFDARMTALHVIPAQPGRAARREDVAEAQQELRTRCDAAGITGECRAETGPMPSAIFDAVTRFNADLLVIGRGHDADAGGHLHSSAYAILHQCGCPVLSVAAGSGMPIPERAATGDQQGLPATAGPMQ